MDIHMQPVQTGSRQTRTIREFSPEIKIIGVSVQAERSYVNEMLRKRSQRICYQKFFQH